MAPLLMKLKTAHKTEFCTFHSSQSCLFVDRASLGLFPTVCAFAPMVDLDLDDSWN